MTYAVIGALAFKNASRRDGIGGNLRARLSPQGMWGPALITDEPSLSPHDAPAPSLRVEVRFLAEADRDAFYDDALAAMTGANGPLAGSWLAKHTCTHDEPSPGPCVEADRRTF